jgi:hypothetical protein
MYAPIAPNPLGPQGPPGPPGPQMQRTSAPKRSRDDDDLSDQSKRRKRSDSNNATFAFELNDEDRLLIRLKDITRSLPCKCDSKDYASACGNGPRPISELCASLTSTGYRTNSTSSARR